MKDQPVPNVIEEEKWERKGRSLYHVLNGERRFLADALDQNNATEICDWHNTALSEKRAAVAESVDAPEKALGKPGAELAATHVPQKALVQLLRSAKAMLAVARYARDERRPYDNLAPSSAEIKLWDQDIESAEKILLSEHDGKAGAPPVTLNPAPSSSSANARKSLEEPGA